MPDHQIERAAAARGFPLLIQSLLLAGMQKAPSQEIVFPNKLR